MIMECAICKKEFRGKQLSTVRESWIKAGGWGSIPEGAIVHPACDKSEMVQIENGKIKLSDLWTK
jgi:hypothetical protein